jgi:hypothetical protein
MSDILLGKFAVKKPNISSQEAPFVRILHAPAFDLVVCSNSESYKILKESEGVPRTRLRPNFAYFLQKYSEAISRPPVQEADDDMFGGFSFPEVKKPRLSV